MADSQQKDLLSLKNDINKKSHCVEKKEKTITSRARLNFQKLKLKIHEFNLNFLWFSNIFVSDPMSNGDDDQRIHEPYTWYVYELNVHLLW